MTHHRPHADLTFGSAAPQLVPDADTAQDYTKGQTLGLWGDSVAERHKGEHHKGKHQGGGRKLLARRILSIHLPRFALERLLPYHPDILGACEALTREENGRRVIHAATPEAEAQGVHAGQPLTDARALVADLKVRAHDPAAELRALDKLAGWAERYTPKVAVSGVDGLTLDITGCAHLLGGERAMMRDLALRLQGFGLTVGLAIADTPAAASVTARFGQASEAIVDPATQAEAVADLPILGLGLPAAVVDGLARVGLTRIGQLYTVARAPLAARFGTVVGTRLDQLLGRIDEPITPRRQPPRHRVRLAFAEPVGNRKDIDAATRRLLSRLCERLEADGRGVRRLTLAAHRVDGAVLPMSIGTGAAVRDPDRLFRLFADHFDKLDPGFGIEVMTLEAPETNGMAPIQSNLQAQKAHQADETQGPLVDRLINRLGAERVVRMKPVDRHLPERSEEGVCVDEPGKGAAVPSSVPWAVGQGVHGRARPLRLLQSPEPVEVVAMVPDSPPVMVFWRGAALRITAAEGPERIGAEWWLEKAPPRDYYKVQDGEGRRFWIFRDRPYGGSEEPRWFIHGIFA